MISGKTKKKDKISMANWLKVNVKIWKNKIFYTKKKKTISMEKILKEILNGNWCYSVHSTTCLTCDQISQHNLQDSFKCRKEKQQLFRYVCVCVCWLLNLSDKKIAYFTTFVFNSIENSYDLFIKQYYYFTYFPFLHFSFTKKIYNQLNIHIQKRKKDHLCWAISFYIRLNDKLY